MQLVSNISLSIIRNQTYQTLTEQCPYLVIITLCALVHLYYRLEIKGIRTTKVYGCQSANVESNIVIQDIYSCKLLEILVTLGLMKYILLQRIDWTRYRSVADFLFRQGNNSREVFIMMAESYPNRAPELDTIQRWKESSTREK
ncbi:MAG: hypothetical protein EZS28_039095 [Streblomastix strix]|uniref:Uncharacterized protein n=1 Tax=Streblomastix strix TaxID=222440 RepID=A0A5J4U4V2_9EUKA|nr:MAG: hypothetical protein EZS28_039095 [Streblomastix strix]